MVKIVNFMLYVFYHNFLKGVIALEDYHFSKQWVTGVNYT